MTNYLQCYLSAENHNQAENILKILTAENLILGGTILEGPSHFWWKGNPIDMNYLYILGFTNSRKKEKLIQKFEEISEEEIPMVSFMDISVNQVFGDFIDENTINK